MTRMRPTAAFVLASCLLAAAAGARANQVLSGDQEVPPVATTASGTGTIAISPDGAVTGSVTTQGIVGTMAHIHAGLAGANGPAIVPLSKSGDNVWTVPAGTKLSADQMKAYRDGGLYVNVHSADHQGGEIRAQLKP